MHYLKIESTSNLGDCFVYVPMNATFRYSKLKKPHEISLKEVLIYHRKGNEAEKSLPLPKNDTVPAGYKVIDTVNQTIIFNGNAYLIKEGGKTIERF